MNSTRMIAAGLALAAALAAPRHAAAADNAQASAEPQSSATLGTQVERGGSYTLTADVALSASEQTDWTLAAHRDTNAAHPASASAAGLSTTGVSAGVQHDFGGFGIDLGVGGWQDPQAVRAAEVTAALRLGPDALNVSLQSEARHSSFEPFAANATVTLPNGTPQTVNATAHCSLDNAGAGAELAGSSEGWSGTLGAMKYLYASTDCSFSAPGLGALRKTNKAQFRQLAAQLSRRLARHAASRLSAQDSFLDYSLTGGATYRAERLSYGLDAEHSSDLLDGNVTDSLAGNVAVDIGTDWTLTLEAGASTSSAFGTLPFAGLRATGRF